MFLAVFEERFMSKKRKVSLSIDGDLLERAGQKGIDLDEALEHALRRYGCEVPLIAKARADAWREENREAVNEMNAYVEKHGLWWETLARAPSRRPASKTKPKTP
jgi:antitoxin CcdA